MKCTLRESRSNFEINTGPRNFFAWRNARPTSAAYPKHHCPCGLHLRQPLRYRDPLALRKRLDRRALRFEPQPGLTLLARGDAAVGDGVHGGPTLRTAHPSKINAAPHALHR